MESFDSCVCWTVKQKFLQYWSSSVHQGMFDQTVSPVTVYIHSAKAVQCAFCHFQEYMLKTLVFETWNNDETTTQHLVWTGHFGRLVVELCSFGPEATSVSNTKKRRWRFRKSWRFWKFLVNYNIIVLSCARINHLPRSLHIFVVAFEND